MLTSLPGRRRPSGRLPYDCAEVDRPQALGVGENVDLSDAVAVERESDDCERLITGEDDKPGRAVDRGGPGARGEVAEGHRLLRDLGRAVDLAASTERPNAGAEGAPDNDLRIEHTEQRLEVAATRGGEERVDELALPRRRDPRGRLGATDPSPCPTRELPRGGRRALDDRSDLVERQPEGVVQHERESFRR